MRKHTQYDNFKGIILADKSEDIYSFNSIFDKLGIKEDASSCIIGFDVFITDKPFCEIEVQIKNNKDEITNHKLEMTLMELFTLFKRCYININLGNIKTL